MQLFGENRLSEDDEIVLEKGDVFDEFISKATFAGAIGGPSAVAHQHAHNFRVASQERDAAVTAHYKKLAFAVTTKKEDLARLEKRTRREIRYGDAGDPRQVAKRDVTQYSGGRSLVAELDENGRVIRIVEEWAV